MTWLLGIGLMAGLILIALFVFAWHIARLGLERTDRDRDLSDW